MRNLKKQDLEFKIKDYYTEMIVDMYARAKQRIAQQGTTETPAEKPIPTNQYHWTR